MSFDALDNACLQKNEQMLVKYFTTISLLFTHFFVLQKRRILSCKSMQHACDFCFLSLCALYLLNIFLDFL